MHTFYLEISMWLVKRLTCDFEIETSSVNEEQTTIPPHPLLETIHMSWKLITTHNNNGWKFGRLKQKIIISMVINNVKM